MRYDEAIECVVCHTFGSLQTSDLLDAGAEAAALLKKHDCRRMLNDMREVEQHLSVVDIYNIPKMSGEFGFPPQTKRAIVFKKDAKDYHFYENVAVNRGHLVKIFKEIDEAIAWLRG